MKFTEDADLAIVYATNYCNYLNHEILATHHLLYGVFNTSLMVSTVLSKFEINNESITRIIEKKYPRKYLNCPLKTNSSAFIKSIEIAKELSRNYGNDKVNSNFLFAGLLKYSNKNSSNISKMLEKFVEIETLMKQLEKRYPRIFNNYNKIFVE